MASSSDKVLKEGKADAGRLVAVGRTMLGIRPAETVDAVRKRMDDLMMMVTIWRYERVSGAQGLEKPQLGGGWYFNQLAEQNSSQH
jgi:hypothetical protein